MMGSDEKEVPGFDSVRFTFGGETREFGAINHDGAPDNVEAQGVPILPTAGTYSCEGFIGATDFNSLSDAIRGHRHVVMRGAPSRRRCGECNEKLSGQTLRDARELGEARAQAERLVRERAAEAERERQRIERERLWAEGEEERKRTLAAAVAARAAVVTQPRSFRPDSVIGSRLGSSRNRLLTHILTSTLLLSGLSGAGSGDGNRDD